MGLPIEFFPAEVKEVIYSDATPTLIYGVRVKILDDQPVEDEESPNVVTAVPLNYNVLRIPIVGEVVLVLRAPSSFATGVRNSQTLYYIDVVSLQSSTHHNALPTIANKKSATAEQSNNSDNYNESSSGNTKQESDPKLDSDFQENPTAKPLQHYVGDVIFEGRYGQSIRFSTTPKSGKFTVAPRWSGSAGNPISIFRNSRQGTDTKRINDFVTEDFTKEDNILVLASGQNIQFEQASGILDAINSKKITSWKDENWGTTPQALLSSGRIVFNSTQKEIIAFAKNGIGLSTETSIALDAKESISINSAKIELGVDADEPLILGNKWKSWAESLIDDLGKLTVVTPAGPSSPLSASPQWPTIASLKSKIPDLLSESAFTKKSATSTGSSSKFSSLPEPNFKLTEEEVKKKEEEKEAAKEKAKDPALTKEEQDANKDVANRAEQEIKTQEAVKAPAPVSVSTDDIIENASEPKTVAHNNKITEEEQKKIDEEVAQPESEGSTGDKTGTESTGDLENWVADYEIDETPEDPEVEFDFESTDYTVTTPSATFSEPYKVPQEIIDFGIKVATIANNDETNLVKEDPIGSNGLGSDRIKVMMANVNCNPGNAPWHAAAVATWCKEAGLPIPAEGQSTVQGWLKWGRDTNRFTLTPIVGSVIIIGTSSTDADNKQIENATDIGVVVQVIDETRVLCCQVLTGEVKLTEVNIKATLGFILPSDKDLPKPDPKPGLNAGELADNPGFVINTGHDGRQHVVFQQGSKAGPWGKNGKPNAPWNPLHYGSSSQSTIAEGGCGICSIAAVVRNLTGHPEVDPYFFGLRYGGNDYGPPSDPKKYPKDRSNFHAAAGGSYHNLIEKGADDYGLKWKRSPSEAECKATLQKGGYLVAVGKGSKPYSGGGHFVHFYDYDGTHFLCGNSVMSWNGQKCTWDTLKSGNRNLWAIWNENAPAPAAVETQQEVGDPTSSNEADGTEVSFTSVPSNVNPTSTEYVIAQGTYTAEQGNYDHLHSFDTNANWSGTPPMAPGKMASKVESKLKEFKSKFNKPAQVAGMVINIDEAKMTVTWKVLIQESKDGKHYPWFTTRGSAKSVSSSLSSTKDQMEINRKGIVGTKNTKTFTPVYFFKWKSKKSSLLITQIFATYTN